MSTIALTLYVLAWPVVVLVVAGVIAKAFFAEWRAAKRDGVDLI